jgi:hypothetical protein
LANLSISSSSLFEKSALLPLTLTWLYVACFVCGVILGTTLESARAVLFGVCSMALIAVLVFSGVLMLTTWLNDLPVDNLVWLVAFQQSFVRFILISLLGGVGASCATLLKLFLSGGL